MAENKLSAKKVASIKTPGRVGDGGGLYLETRIGVDGMRHQSWLFRYKIGGRGREMGLGSLTASNGLAEARAERNRWRSVIKSGRDPITVRRQEEQAKALAAAGTITFKQAADEFIATQVANSRWRAKATEIDWRGQFETYATPVLGTLAMADITPQLIDRVLKPIWGHPILGQRVRQRLEELFDAAIALGYRATENPCRLRRVKHALGKRAKHKPTNFAAMAVSEIGAFVAELREQQIAAPADPSSWALEFLVLTVRVGQVRWMRWREVDLATATWISPGAEWDTRGGLVAKGHTKSGRDHRVALNERAVAILRAQPGEHQPDDFVFQGAKPGAPQGRNTLRIWMHRQLKRDDITLHGLRSVFRDWVALRTKFPRELAEYALDHAEAVGDKTERAYQRDDLLERRRPMMKAWGAFLDRPPTADNVAPLPVKAA
jgi:hypothetical protein